MTRNKILLALTGLIMILSACTADSPQTGAPSTSSTTANEATTTSPPGTTTRGEERPIDVVDCDVADEEVAIVCEAVDLIQSNYVDEIDGQTLAEAASRGLEALDGADDDRPLTCAVPVEDFAPVCDLAARRADDTSQAAEAMVAGMTAHALDPNSAYFDPESLDLLEEEQEGEIEGIGALVSPEDQTLPGEDKQCAIVSETCQILIISTIGGAPAQEAGLQRDDEIVGVDGQSIIGWTVDEVTASVRGPAGTDVTLAIERNGEEFEVTITRAAVVIPAVEQDVFDDVGYVRLSTFSGTASAQFKTAIVDVLSAGVDELVVDLRDNPGGFLTTAIDVTSIFLADGDVVMTEGPEGTITYPVEGEAIVPGNMTVTFVVNKGSASASEVVAATLQERGLVTVVGENTFGKNTVQQRFSLSNGGALKLTIARWLTPGGHDFGGTGVTPDVEMDVSALDPEELVAAVTG